MLNVIKVGKNNHDFLELKLVLLVRLSVLPMLQTVKMLYCSSSTFHSFVLQGTAPMRTNSQKRVGVDIIQAHE